MNNRSQKRNAESSCCGSLRQQPRGSTFYASFFLLLDVTLLFISCENFEMFGSNKDFLSIQSCLAELHDNNT